MNGSCRIRKPAGKPFPAENEKKAKGKKEDRDGTCARRITRAADSCSAQKNAGKNPGTNSHIFRLNPIWGGAWILFVAGSRVSGRLCRLVWAISELGPGNRDYSCTWQATYSKSWQKRPSRTLAGFHNRFPVRYRRWWVLGVSDAAQSYMYWRNRGSGLWFDPRSGFSPFPL